MGWLGKILDSMDLVESDVDYLMGRGGKEETIKELGIKTWNSNIVDDSSIGDGFFRKEMGPSGSRIDGYIVIPFFSPMGEIIGLEARNHEKSIVDYRDQPSYWNPVTIGMNRYIKNIVRGGNIWIVEGVFDLFAMEWVIPVGDSVLATVRANIGKMLSKFLFRFSPSMSSVGGNVKLVYDNDDAGLKGTEISLCTLKKYGSFGRAIKYAGYKDPGEVWDSGGEGLLLDVFGKYR